MRQPPYTLPLNALLPSPSDEPTGRPIISAGISANCAPENVKKFVADGGPLTAILIAPSIQTTMQGASRLQDTRFRSPSLRRSQQLEIRDPFQIAEIEFAGRGDITSIMRWAHGSGRKVQRCRTGGAAAA